MYMKHLRKLGGYLDKVVFRERFVAECVVPRDAQMADSEPSVLYLVRVIILKVLHGDHQDYVLGLIVVDKIIRV
jgi:hypothetical protein